MDETSTFIIKKMHFSVVMSYMVCVSLLLSQTSFVLQLCQSAVDVIVQGGLRDVETPGP